jgi:iron complex transport system ATP-binding protein
MDLEALSDRPVTMLSGGEQQQAVIARALVTRPPVVLFDEPTAHLDFGNQVRVLRIIKGLTQKGFAVVLTTHNPDHALLLGGRAAVLNSDGHLRTGPVDGLLTEETLQQVYGAELRLAYIAEFGRKVCVYPNLE